MRSRAMRTGVVGTLLVLVGACGDGGVGPPDADLRGAPAAVAVVDGSRLRIYEGYPGIGYDIDAIEAEDAPNRFLYRITLPVADLASGSFRYDLAMPAF